MNFNKIIRHFRRTPALLIGANVSPGVPAGHHKGPPYAHRRNIERLCEREINNSDMQASRWDQFSTFPCFGDIAAMFLVALILMESVSRAAVAKLQTIIKGQSEGKFAKQVEFDHCFSYTGRLTFSCNNRRK